MCGIVGIVSFDENVEPWRAEIEKSIALMARRGPDDHGIWSDGERCMLGFRRLAILDLTPAAHQPMLSPDGRYALVFNGEVYNFRELRRELESEGVTFRSTGDAEVVLHALIRWGTNAPARFNGMFALGFYDTVERRLLLARDHAGVKPLYYLYTSRGVLFASQYDQILAHPWARERGVIPAHLALYLHIGYLPAPYAMLQDSYALEPGTLMSIDADGVARHGRHFTMPVFREPDLRGDAADEAVDAAVTAAVRRHLVSDVPVGLFLSGGIDSPLVGAAMVEGARRLFPAFTLSTGADRFDESPDAAAYARELGLDHYLCPMTSEIALAMLDDVVAACGEPLDDFSMFPTMLVARHARGRVKVALSGDGADEIFFGYPRRMIPFLRARDSTAVSAPSRRAYIDPQRLVPAGWIDKLFPDLPAVPPDCELFANPQLPNDRMAQWMRRHEFTGHLTRVLQKVDRASMYHGLEVRVPLLDRELVELACRIDWRASLDIAGGLGKLPLRAALRRHSAFQTESKRGFTVAMSEWLRGALRPIFEDVVLSRAEIIGMPLCRDQLRRDFQDHLEQRVDLGWGLWRLLSLCLWEKRHYRAAYAG
jgi:asparagine synthase (glutamine-hydrolysing)